ncbi:MAG: MerR family transcriptional regulator [Deltaproteobacteria bacterium]|nr:MerR family transcriptional regulator [Deltaproteobacteria bacterium]
MPRPKKRTVLSPEIPDRPFFKIGDVAKLCAVKPYVLRYWETEFKSLRPQKTTSGQRLYTREHVDLVLRIRDLLHNQRFTIEGARASLRDQGLKEETTAKVPDPALDRETLKKLKQGIIDLLALVEQ